MLVVIVIIGILASLITVAAVAALDKAHQTQIKLEMDQIASAFERYKNQYGSYPPNLVRDNSIPDDVYIKPILRHFKKAFPRNKDPIVEIFLDRPLKNATNEIGISPAQAIFFFLGGYSSDPEHPLTGPGGPIMSPLNSEASPDAPSEFVTRKRSGLFEFDETRLSTSKMITLRAKFPGTTTKLALRLSVYNPPKLTQPFVYFDTSRRPPYDPTVSTPVVPAGRSTVWWPAYLEPATRAVLIRPYVRPGKTAKRRIDWINPKKFQILSTGTDDEWGGEFLSGNRLTDVKIIYPVGPYTDPLTEHADNLVSFSPRTLEDSQP